MLNNTKQDYLISNLTHCGCQAHNTSLCNYAKNVEIFLSRVICRPSQKQVCNYTPEMQFPIFLHVTLTSFDNKGNQSLIAVT